MNLERQSFDIDEVQPGPSWAPKNWPVLDSDDLTAALDPQQMQIAVKAAAAQADATLSNAEVEPAAGEALRVIGSTSCRESECRDDKPPVVAVALQKQKT